MNNTDGNDHTFQDIVAAANRWGRAYRDAVANGETARVVSSATSFLAELGGDIPNIDENNDAKVLLFAIHVALTESMHGKRTHPLLQSAPQDEHVGGVRQRGIKAELIAGLAAGAVVFLERQKWRPDPACRFVSKSLAVAGVSGFGLTAMKNIRNEESMLTEPRLESRRYVGHTTNPHADRAEREFAESGKSDPGAFIKKWLRDQLPAISTLSGYGE